jgi:hypothetical protein
MWKLALESASHGKHPIIGFGGAFPSLLPSLPYRRRETFITGQVYQWKSLIASTRVRYYR